MATLDRWTTLILSHVWDEASLERHTYPLVAHISGRHSLDVASVEVGRGYELPVLWTPRRRALRLDVRPGAIVAHVADDPDHRTMLRHGESLRLTSDERLLYLEHADTTGTLLPRGLGMMLVGEVASTFDGTSCAVGAALRCPGHDLPTRWDDEDRARLCGRCATLVHRVTTEAELVHHLAMGHCIAVPELLARLVRVVRTETGVRVLRREEDEGAFRPRE